MHAHLLRHVQRKIAHAMYFWQTLESRTTAALYVRLSFLTTRDRQCLAIVRRLMRSLQKLLQN